MNILYLILAFCMLSCCAPTPSSSIFDDVTTPGTGGGGGDDDGDLDDYTPEVTSSIIALKSNYIGATTKLTKTLTICGQVVANDIRDEFKYTMILRDATGAIEVSVDLDNIAYEFPLGCYVTFVCDDLWLGSRGGTLVVGAQPTGDDVVDKIGKKTLASRLYYVEKGAVSRPKYLKISELSVLNVSDYIAIENIRFLTAEGSTFCKRDPDTGRSVSTKHMLECKNGESIELFVSSSTNYADDIIPMGYGTIYAIVDLYAGSYSLRLIDRGLDFSSH